MIKIFSIFLRSQKEGMAHVTSKMSLTICTTKLCVSLRSRFLYSILNLHVSPRKRSPSTMIVQRFANPSDFPSPLFSAVFFIAPSDGELTATRAWGRPYERDRVSSFYDHLSHNERPSEINIYLYVSWYTSYSQLLCISFPATATGK